jgi:hypothetical protein
VAIFFILPPEKGPAERPPRDRQIPNKEKPGVLHGNDRLRRRENLKQRDLLIDERAYLMPLVCSAT